MAFQGRTDVLRSAVDRPVASELVDAVAAFLRTTRDPDRTTAFDPGDLHGRPLHPSGGPRDHDRVSLLGPSDDVEPEVGGHAGHPERAEINGKRDERRIDRDDPGSIRDRIFLDAEETDDI